jgi:hypothetical protein
MQTFREEANNEDFAVIMRAVDWGRARWELEELSGRALRHVPVDRPTSTRLIGRGIVPRTLASWMGAKRSSIIGSTPSR